MSRHFITGIEVEKLQLELGKDTWPEFMQHDDIVNKYWPYLYKYFPQFQFALFEDKLLFGVGNSIPVFWDQPMEDLPSTGLDWAMEKAYTDHHNGVHPNLMVGVQILIETSKQSKGISYKMLAEMKRLAYDYGINRIALPVRPSKKYEFPNLSMDEYLDLKDDAGQCLDPWIRVHVKSGGKVIKPCNESMSISGTINMWEAWTGLKFPHSGDYIVEHALVPIQIDLVKDLGIYIEPNVWILHSTQPD